ncbi:unnamed protein product [Heligmosomoides polygyrus]|uniref:protein-serine/threonine phosphatase n=1 Tax=Heligmosomoides polygyrus TaxID=6339 RepID=A0A183GDX2_HELPZ|nr:unnamed protein product [Heligmosomoides polygyrus]
MPIACVISDQIICMHGGLSPKIQLVSQIAELQRPLLRDAKPGAHVDIMWSDPHIAKWTFEPNVLRDPAGIGVGYLFGPIQIHRFLKKNKIEMFYRMVISANSGNIDPRQKDDNVDIFELGHA